MNTNDLIKLLGGAKLQSKIQMLAAKASPRFGSSRLLVTLGVILGLVWFFHGQLGSILGMIQFLAITFLVCRTLTDISTIVMDGLIKRELAKQLARDGSLSEEDQDAINDVGGSRE